MITHIKTESGSIGTRSKTDQVEKLFKTIMMSYKMNNDKYMYFKQGQEIATVIQYFLKYQRDHVPSKCLEIQFTTSRIYPSPVGIMDGLNISKLFSSEQAIPASSALTATATAGTHLATIATTMLTAIIGLTSKADANHANADEDETIDYKDMLIDVHVQYNLKNHPVNIITGGDLKLYHNDLTVDKHNARQKLRTVEYSAFGTGNTTRHDDQTYLIMNDGTLFDHLDHQSTKNKTAFITGAPDMIEWTLKGWFEFYLTMEKSGTINKVLIFPYYCRRLDAPSKWGFSCADQNDVAEADLPYKYQSKIDGWGVQIMSYLRKILSRKANEILTQCGTDGHQALQLLHLKFHSIHFRYQTDQYKTVPVQENLSINAYTSSYN